MTCCDSSGGNNSETVKC